MLPSMRLLFLHCILEQDTAKEAGSQYKLHHANTNTHHNQFNISLREGRMILDIVFTCGSQARSCIARSDLRLERSYHLELSIRNPKHTWGSLKHKLMKNIHNQSLKQSSATKHKDANFLAAQNSHQRTTIRETLTNY